MKDISMALVKAQKEFGPALKTSSNPHFRSKYADLSACVEAVIDGLNNNGIFLMQTSHLCEDGVIVETVFIHESGEQISAGKLHVPASKQDAQGYGSALTYARRYALMSACGIAPEDDDGNASSKKPPAPPKPAPEPTPKVPKQIEGTPGKWQFSITSVDPSDTENYLAIVNESADICLGMAQAKKDVMEIFKVNREIFDSVKRISEESYKAILQKFTIRKEQLN